MSAIRPAERCYGDQPLTTAQALPLGLRSLCVVQNENRASGRKTLAETRRRTRSAGFFRQLKILRKLTVRSQHLPRPTSAAAAALYKSAKFEPSYREPLRKAEQQRTTARRQQDMAEILESAASGAPTPAPDAAAAPEESKEPPLEFNTTFQGQKLVLRVKRDGVVADLKAAITDETQVPAKRQKLIGLVKGALPPDESKLAELVGPRGEKPPTKFLLMGTPDDKLFVDPKDRDDLPEILDDLDPVSNCVESNQ